MTSNRAHKITILRRGADPRDDLTAVLSEPIEIGGIPSYRSLIIVYLHKPSTETLKKTADLLTHTTKSVRLLCYAQDPEAQALTHEIYAIIERE